MTTSAAPKDITLNIPEKNPKIVKGSSANFLNWQNWLAAILAIFIVFLAYAYSFLPLNEKAKMFENITGNPLDSNLLFILKARERYEKERK